MWSCLNSLFDTLISGTFETTIPGITLDLDCGVIACVKIMEIVFCLMGIVAIRLSGYVATR